MFNPIQPVKNLHPTEVAIINTALSQLLTGNIHQLSVTRLVKTSGISRSVFYQYFAGKDDLLASLLLADEVSLAESMKPYMASGELAPLLKSYLKYRFQDIDKYRKILEIETTLSGRLEHLKRFKDWQRLRQSHADQIKSIAEQHKRREGQTDNDQLEFYFGLVWTLSSGLASISNSDDFTQLIRDRRGFSRFLLKTVDSWMEDEK